MKQMLKRSFALLLVLCMCLSVLPMQAFAATAPNTAADYLSQCTKYSTYLILEATSADDDIKSLPCSWNTNSASKDVRAMKKGETYTCLAIYKNTAGNYWYEVTATSDYKTGYIYGGTAKFKSFGGNAVLSDVTIATTTPKQGVGCAIKGSITTTSLGKVTINSATGILKDAQGKSQTKTITSGFGDISKTALNSDLKFGSLSRGPGSLTITTKYSCQDTSGTALTTVSGELKQTIKFTVQGTYSVVYNANGGTNAPASQTKTYGKSLTLTTSVPTRPGYAFLGWSTNKAATSATYKAGATLNTDVYTGNITLYAIWAKVDLEAPTISVGNVASTGKPKISWNKVDGAAKYELYWAASKTGTYTKIGTTTGTSLINKSAKTGKMYYYKVKAVDADGNKSEFSNVVNRTCDIPQPVIKATNIASTGKVKLSWEPIEGAVKYELYRATSKNGTYTKIGTTKNSYIVNTSGVAGTLYYYKVRALHGTNSGAHSAFSNVVERSCDLAQPTLTVKLNSNDKPVLTWSKVEGAVKYQVYRATSKDGTYSLIYTTGGTTCTNTKNVEEGRTYYYKVRACCNNSGATSAYSAIKNITVSTALVIK